MPPESVSPGELADAYWGNHQRREALDEAREPRPYDPEAGDRILVEGDGWRVIAHKRRDDEPDEPRTGLEWGWEMVDSITLGEMWRDWDAQEEGRAARLAPAIDRLELLELLAERAPDDDALDYLGADAIYSYLGGNPDVAGIEEAAQRSRRLRAALSFCVRTSSICEHLPPDDVARLRRFGDRD